MAAGRFDFRGRSGVDFTRVFYFKDPAGNLINLTGYNVRASFRRGPKSISLLNLSSGSGLALGGAAGTVTLTITKAQMALLIGSGIFAIELESSGGLIDDFIEGNFVVSADTVTT